jgi:UDP-glucose-4-epimerase GalE
VRVLVTGGAGYIGSHAAAGLIRAGHAVTIVDDLSAGHEKALPKQGARFVRLDVGHRAPLASVLAGHDAVMHFAGLLSVAGSMRDPQSYFETNFVGGLALLDAMRDAGVTRLIFSSTCATYGIPRGPLDETHPQEPVNPYGVSKRMFEQALEAYARIGRVKAVALRYFNAAGAAMDGSLGEDHAPEEHLIPLAIDAALGRTKGLTIYGDDYPTDDGTCVRDYVHVDDLARAHVTALERIDTLTGPGQGFLAFNLGTGRGTTVREVVREVERALGRPVPHTVGPRRAGDPPSLVAVPARAFDALGFQPALGLPEIVSSAAKWRESHRDGYRTL